MNDGVVFTWDAVFPLFAFTSPDFGGLGFSVNPDSLTFANEQTRTIGLIMMCSACLCVLMLIFVLPMMHRYFSFQTLVTICEHSRCYPPLTAGLLCYPIATALFPVLWLLRSRGLNGFLFMLLAVQIVIRRTGDFSST